jgi:hypothetical protein
MGARRIQMHTKKGLRIALATAPLVAALLGAPAATRAATPAKHVHCETMKNGKTQTTRVATAEDCTKMGGKVVVAEKKHK